MSEPVTPTFGIEDRTLVFDRARQRLVMWIEGLVPAPVGTEVELRDPNVSARVTGVRILAAAPNMMLCLDCEVPQEYWGNEDEADESGKPDAGRPYRY